MFSYDGNVVMTAPSSNDKHHHTSVGKLHNTPVVVGHWNRVSYNKKVEALQAGIWNALPDYPFVERYIYGYSMVNFKDVLYLFGK